METASLRGSGRNLALATIAFAACFSAWGMLAPIAPALQEDLGLSNIQTSIMISIPVVLGSLLRIPLGILTDRIGGRKVFTAMIFYSAGAAVLVGFASSEISMSLAKGHASRDASITPATVSGSIRLGVPPPKKMLFSTRPGNSAPRRAISD